MPPAYTRGATNAGGIWDTTAPYNINIAAWAAVALNPFTHGSTGYQPIVYSRTQFLRGDPAYTFPVKAFILKPQQHFLRSRLSSP